MAVIYMPAFGRLPPISAPAHWQEIAGRFVRGGDRGDLAAAVLAMHDPAIARHAVAWVDELMQLYRAPFLADRQAYEYARAAVLRDTGRLCANGESQMRPEKARAIADNFDEFKVWVAICRYREVDRHPSVVASLAKSFGA
jgi:hypothetical protein